MRKAIITFGILLFIIACKSTDLPNYGIDSTLQGIKGNVLITDPGSEIPKRERKEVYVFEQFMANSAQSEGNIYKDIQAKLVRRIVTNENGSFVLALPTGKYSLMVGHSGGYFAPEKDAFGNVNPITVIDGEFVDVDVIIDSALTY
jgi:hypothetical protein